MCITNSLLHTFGQPSYFVFPIQMFCLSATVEHTFVNLDFKYTLSELKTEIHFFFLPSQKEMEGGRNNEESL